MRKAAILVVAVALGAFLLWPHPVREPATHAGAASSGTTYYVSRSGKDWRSGTSPGSAWRTVARVDRARLRPGDQVLFRGGETFDDEPLIPRDGGASGAPITYGTYESGRAGLPLGVYFKHVDHLAFEKLSIVGPKQGIDGFGSDVLVADCAIARVSLGIQSHGSHWLIIGNTVDHTGDSGLLLYGASEYVSDNTITNTGLNAAIPYGKHGIYLKAPDSTVAGNTITNFSEDGISVRYRNSVVTGNQIRHGAIGIAWFQYDTRPGTSHWTGNSIAETTAAGIYISSIEAGTRTIERFVLTHNRIAPASGVSVNVATGVHATA